MTREKDGHDGILFTGFPGFIGARLLPRLLTLRRDTVFHCLVQDRFVELARTQIRDIEKKHKELKGRLEIAVGDITTPGLGIEPARAQKLRKDLVGAYHLAAVYDLAVSPEVGTRINVDGTKNVLDFLAGAKRFEKLDYVSTAYVSGDAKGIYRETDLDVGQGFKNHYEETKFLAEVEVVKSGLPAAIYRPGIVVGDSRTGETAKFDGPYFVLSAMDKLPSPGMFIRIGSGGFPVNVVPVDYVIEALARLSASPVSRGRTYNLTDPNPPTSLELAQLFASILGKSFAFVPMPMALARALLSAPPLKAWLSIPIESLDYFDNPCRYDAAQATHDLAAFDIACPRFPDYAEKLVAFYQEKRGEVRRTAMI
jgi:thioester reductase-like protein